MKKTIAILFAAITLTASAQKKDSTVKTDTVFVLSVKDMETVTGILRSNTVQLGGKNLTFDDVLQLIQYFNSKVVFIPRKEPKEQPKK